MQDHKQWRNIAFCLGQLSIGEKGFRKLADLFRCYKDSLADPDILAFFQVTPHHNGIAAVLLAHHVLVLGDWDNRMLDRIQQLCLTASLPESVPSKASESKTRERWTISLPFPKLVLSQAQPTCMLAAALCCRFSVRLTAMPEIPNPLCAHDS